MRHMGVVLVAGLFASSPAMATEFYHTGLVQKLFALDRGIHGPDKSHILVAGLSSAGSCPTNDGLVALALRDDDGGKRQLSVSLTAKVIGKTVVIRVDDAVKNEAGQCYLKYLELN
jgi:hypothetical protein